MTDYPYNLGTYSRPVTTLSSVAQQWFDRGLNWLYGYHHEEAGVCFKQCLEHDADCAMAHWGLAYIVGPNYNRPWGGFSEAELSTLLLDARESLAAARAKMHNATAEERALIHALGLRYQAHEPAADPSVWSNDYANQMRVVHQTYRMILK